MVNFPTKEVRSMGRTASGVKGIELEDGCEAIGSVASYEGNKILVLTDKGYGKMTDVYDENGELVYRVTKRGAKGVSTIKASDKTGKIVAISAVNGDEDLLVITNYGVVMRTSLSEVRVSGRNTQGVKIINLEGRQKVSTIAIVPHEDEEDEEISDPLDEGVEENESTPIENQEEE